MPDLPGGIGRCLELLYCFLKLQPLALATILLWSETVQLICESSPSVVDSLPIGFKLPSLSVAVVFRAELRRDDLLKTLLFVCIKITGIWFSIPEPLLHWGVGVWL